MCIAPKIPKAAPTPIAAYDNTEALRQGDIEAKLRRRRSGPAATILTSAMGIPSGQSTAVLGSTV